MESLRRVTAGRAQKLTAFIKLVTSSADTSCFTSAVQLKDKEYVYLNAAEFGEVEMVRTLLEDEEVSVSR